MTYDINAGYGSGMNTPAPADRRAVAALIQAAIESGEYPRGSELPLQDDLAARYGVNQATISNAMSILVAKGLVQSRRGKRAVVTAIPPIVRNPALRYSKTRREHAGAG